MTQADLANTANDSIAHNLAAVRERIHAAAGRSSRAPESVRLVAVSKTKPASMIREAYAAGQRDFGENYAKELDEKASALADLEDLRWHFIGHLQSNKAKVVARWAHVIHAIHSVDLAEELGKRAFGHGRRDVACLVEVNVSGEASKHGAPPAEVDDVVEAIARADALRPIGLMTMPPFGDLVAAREVFVALRRIRDASRRASELTELSMGMSDDLEVAISCGATMVRVGTAIFGERA